MKNIFKKSALSFIFFVSFASASGVPTIDAPAFIEMQKQLQEMKKQYDMMKDQYDTMNKQYDAISGINNWNDLINSDYFWDFFPKEAEDVAKGNASIDDILSNINDAIKDDASFSDFKNKELNQIANRQQRAKENYEASVDRIEEIDEIIDKAKDNEELKDSMDYNNVLQGQIALLINELTRITSESQIHEAEALERDKIEDERAKKAMDMSSGAKVYPI